jgi:hypothetical protein
MAPFLLSSALRTISSQRRGVAATGSEFPGLAMSPAQVLGKVLSVHDVLDTVL